MKFAAKSYYFDCLFSRGYAETYKDTITIYGIDSKAFEKIYTILNSDIEDDIYDITYDLAVPMYITCQYLLVKNEYQEPLINFLKNNFNEISIFELYVYCMINKDWSILPEIRHYVAQNIEFICGQHNFQLIPIDVLIDILIQTDLRISEESSLIRIIALWLAYDPFREHHTVNILKTIIPAKYFNKRNLLIHEWSFENIYKTLEKCIFQPRTVRPLISWMNVENEPLYISKDGYMNVVFHFDGTQWTELNKPRIKAQSFSQNDIVYGVRYKSDFFMIEPKSSNSPYSRNIFMHYNFHSQKLSYLRQPTYTPIAGLFLVNNAVYSCSINCVQKYCPEYDMWLTPPPLNVTDSSLFASDGKILYTCGIDDCLTTGKSFFTYDERIKYWDYLTKAPENEDLHCCGFFNNELYVVDGKKVKKLDLRVRQWEEIASLSNQANTPYNLTQCHDLITIMDNRNNTFMYNIKECKWKAFIGDYYPKLSVVQCVG